MDFQEKVNLENIWLATEENDPIAQYELGKCYEKGIRGFTKSDEKAIEFYQMAAKQDMKKAKSALWYLQQELRSEQDKKNKNEEEKRTH